MTLHTLELWFHAAVVEERPGWGPAAIRGLLRLLSIPYALFIQAYWGLFEISALRRVRLPCRVVSFGNLTMGGVGKTVAVRSAAAALRRAGLRCVILSYGYRSRIDTDYAVVSDGAGVSLSATEAGDEPVMLAHALPGVPVLIGKRRALSGTAAVKLFQPDVILLDDGFQYRRLYRDADILLMDARQPVGNGRVFPAGVLREPASGARRATACLLTRCDLVSVPELRQARELVERLAPGVPILETSHRPGSWRVLAPPGASPPGATGLVVVLVSGIARPESFEASVEAQGVRVREHIRFPDHHLYSLEDVNRIVAAANGAAVVTTEKDGVKLAPLWPTAPVLMALPVELAGVSDEEWLRLCGISSLDGLVREQ